MTGSRVHKVGIFLLAVLLVACGGATKSGVDNEPLAGAAAPGASKCGYVRWPQKTGTDAQASTVNMKPKLTSIATLVGAKSPLKPPGKYPPHSVARAAPIETQVWTIHATLTSYGAEADTDLHLVIYDGTNHMIVEIPDPACVSGGPFRAQIAAARATFLAAYPKPPSYPKPQATTRRVVTVTGVGFFDYVHGQAGVAKNGVELHPVLSITFG